MYYSAHRSLFYNPYEAPYISFLIERNSTPSDSSSLNEDSNLTLFDNVNFVSDLELGSQFPNPIVSLAFIIPIQLLLASIAVFIQIRTLQMLKQEKSVNNRLMTTQSKLHIVFWPTIVVGTMLGSSKASSWGDFGIIF